MTSATYPAKARLPLIPRVAAYLFVVVATVLVTALLFLSGRSPVGQVVATVATFAVVLGVTYAFRRYVDRRPWASLGAAPPSRTRLRHLLLGVGIGVAAVVAVLGMQVALGVEVTLVGYATAARGVSGAVGALAVGLFLVTLKAAVEEVAFRGYLITNLHDRLPLPAAALVGGVVFTAAHLPGGVSGPWYFAEALVEFTAWSCLLTWSWKTTGSLWAPTGIHAGWNWAQDYLLGTSTWTSPEVGTALVQLRPDGPAWLIGGPANMDGSVMVVVQTAVIAGGIALMRPGARRRVPAVALGDTGDRS